MWERRLMLLGPHLMSTLQAIEDMKYEIVKYWDWLSVLCDLGYQYPKPFTPQHLNAWKSKANRDQSTWVNIVKWNYAGVLSCDINFLLAVRWITYFIYILKIHTSYSTETWKCTTTQTQQFKLHRFDFIFCSWIRALLCAYTPVTCECEVITLERPQSQTPFSLNFAVALKENTICPVKRLTSLQGDWIQEESHNASRSPKASV